jgi:hypothetical protein
MSIITDNFGPCHRLDETHTRRESLNLARRLTAGTGVQIPTPWLKLA